MRNKVNSVALQLQIGTLHLLHLLQLREGVLQLREGALQHRKRVLLQLAAGLCAVLFCLTFQSSFAVADEVSKKATQNTQDLMARINAIETSESIDPEERKVIIDFYQKAIDNLRAAADNRSKAQKYATQLSEAPARLNELKKQLGDSQRTSESAEVGDLSVEESDILTLEKKLLQQQTELLNLRTKEADVHSNMLAEQQNVTKLLEEAIQQQSVAKDNLNRSQPNESVELSNARNDYYLSGVEEANSRVEMLRQRSLSRATRLEVLDREQQFYSREITAVNLKIKALEEALNNARKKSAEAKVELAKLRASEIESAGPKAKSIAEDNQLLAADLAKITTRTSTLLVQLDKLRKEHNRVDRYYNSMSQQLSVAGAERLSSLSVDLLAQRKQFSKDLPQLYASDALDKELTHAQINQLRLEDRQHASTEPEESDLEGQASGDLMTELQSEQDDLLQDNVKAYRRYTDALVGVHNENADLQTRIKEYQNLLSSRLFWIPSTSPVNVQFVRDLNGELYRLLRQPQWKSIVSAIKTTSALEVAGCLLLAFIIVFFQSRLKRRLTHLGDDVGKVNKDKFSNTLLALAITVVLALPGFFLLLAIGEIVRGGGGFSNQLHKGFINGAIMWFLLGIFYHLCRKQGVAEVHFKWNLQVLGLVRKNLPWLMLLLVLISLVMPIVNHSIEPYDSISRLLFAVTSCALAIVGHSVFKPSASALAEVSSSKSRQFRFFKYVIYLSTTTIPLILILVSSLGYHYSALEIQSRLYLTAWILSMLLVVYSLALRAVSVLERSMKLERLKAKRKAEREMQASRDAADESAESVPDTIELPEVDMEEVSQQSRGFIALVTAIIGTYLLWNLWDNVLPAFDMFNSMELWSVTTEDPNSPVRSVTVLDFVIGIVVLMLTYLGARNIPGALEISVLRNMNLEPGGSYAIITVVKYIITMVGVVASLNYIGIQWSKLQWLVAALGVGLGFGLQEIVANFVSGLLILFERPIRVGDTVTVGEHTGTVTRIRIRATTLTDWDRKEQIIPNKTFITEQLTNWTLSDPITRRVIKVGVAYGSDVAVVHELLTQVIASNKRVTTDPAPAVFFVGFGDSSLDFELRVFVPGLGDLMPLVHELHVAIDACFREHGIEIPFPQRDVWIKTEGVDISSEDAEGNPMQAEFLTSKGVMDTGRKST